ncbi:hypothetical protein OG585_52915 (plasmid) [Streptomyces sp. NBC_01340]|uniref:hypothetical protein n=1 Tax=Streptomyces sp. NBC_01340 TaxID=2903830 RepID=UPI002E117F8E|nr:hypothetical protein OG585_52915 [Streptomyces sp. NBC_01340]
MELPEKRLTIRCSHQSDVHVLLLEQSLPRSLHDIILTRLGVIGSTRRIYPSHAPILPSGAPTALLPEPVHLGRPADRPRSPEIGTRSAEHERLGLDRGFIIALPYGRAPRGRRRKPFSDEVARALAAEDNL